MVLVILLVFIQTARAQVHVGAPIEFVVHFVSFDWMLMKTRPIEKNAYFFMESEPRAGIYPLSVQCRVKFDGLYAVPVPLSSTNRLVIFVRYVRFP